MISAEKIDAVKSKLVQTYNPLEIYLFGSYAWGTPTEDSDLDLLIVVETYHLTRRKMLREGHLTLIGMDISKDLLLYSKEEFEELLTDKMTLCYQIKHEGQLIYAKS